MPAWYLTINTPLGEKHATVRGLELKTSEQAIEHYQMLQSRKGWKSGLPMAPVGDVTDCIPAVWPDHFKSRPPAMDAAYPAALDKHALMK